MSNIIAARLPSDTVARFWLLIILMVFLSSEVGLWFNYNCLTVLPRIYDPVYSRLDAVGCLIIITFLFYLMHEYSKRRQFGPLVGDPIHASLRGEVESLSERIGVKAPRFLVSRDVNNYEAITFGLPGRRTILIGRGLNLAFVRNKALFRARLAHELSHVFNKDVDQALIAQASINALFVIVIGALSSQILGAFTHYSDKDFPLLRHTDFYLQVICNFLLPFLMWVLGASLVYRSFLRSREYYADSRAAEVCGSTLMQDQVDPLRRVAYTQSRFRDLMTVSFKFHPKPAERRARIAKPSLVGLYSDVDFGVFGYILASLGSLQGTTSALLPNTVKNAFSDNLESAIRNMPQVGARGFLLFESLFLFYFGSLISVVFMMCIRSMMQTYLDRVSFVVSLRRGFRIAAFLFIGMMAGETLSPRQLGSLLYSNDLLLFTYHGFFEAISVSVLILGLFVWGLIPLRRLMYGTRSRKVDLWQWFTIYFVLVYSFVQLVQTLMLLFLVDHLKYKVIIVIGNLLFSFSLWVGLFFICKRISGRGTKGSLVELHNIVPWLTQEAV